ncbi:MAG TPA: lipocalin-like domain-containing protein, partial [Polyangiaceae bacterium]|nr:lipocalin-like domain-containing protein [Polyangiaceae bacterium]
MNALPAPQFDTFEEISSLRRLPVDWPEPGPIELSVHDLPHASASLEWWSVNCHVETVDGRDLSLFAAFGRERFPMAPGRRDLAIAHSVVWAICDPRQSLYSAKVSVDGLAPALALAKLDATTDTTGSRLDRALREVLMRGQVPAPTQLLSAPVRVDQSSLGLDYGGDTLFKRGAREYFLSLYDDRTKVGCDLFFVPQKRPVRYGANGIARGARDEVMFHYFIPRCSVSGHVTIDRKTRAVGSGTGWLDHEFGFSHEA